MALINDSDYMTESTATVPLASEDLREAGEEAAMGGKPAWSGPVWVGPDWSEPAASEPVWIELVWDIAQGANDLVVAWRAMKRLPETREQRVAELKARLGAGEYRPDAGKIATAVIRGGI